MLVMTVIKLNIAAKVFGVNISCIDTINLQTLLSKRNEENSKDGTPISSDKQTLTQQELLNVFLLENMSFKERLSKQRKRKKMKMQKHQQTERLMRQLSLERKLKIKKFSNSLMTPLHIKTSLWHSPSQFTQTTQQVFCMMKKAVLIKTTIR